MYINQKEQLHSQTNADGQDMSKENYSKEGEHLVERQKIGGTPYWIVGNKDTGYFITFGKWQMTEPEETMVKAMEYYQENEINIVLTTAIILMNDKLAESKTK